MAKKEPSLLINDATGGMAINTYQERDKDPYESKDTVPMH
jgi:hypothetical protein